MKIEQEEIEKDCVHVVKFSNSFFLSLQGESRDRAAGAAPRWARPRGLPCGKRRRQTCRLQRRNVAISEN